MNSWCSFLSKLPASKLALVEQRTKTRLTYGELLSEVNRAAFFLQSKGVTIGDRVTLLATNRREHLTLFLACAKLGAIFIPLNFRLSPSELQDIVELVNPKISFSDGTPCYEFVTETIDLNHFVLPQNELTEFPEIDLGLPLLMLFTSGTTGSPKGVMLHGQMLLANQEATIKNWGLLPTDTTLVETPFFHTGGYNVLCLPLLKLGGTVILAESFNPENVFKTFREENVSVYFGVPTMFQLLRDEMSSKPVYQEAFSSIRFFVSGGAAISVDLIHSFQKLGVMFKQGFGLTEVGPNCFLLSEEDALRKQGSVGLPMPHSEVLVLKEDGNLAKAFEAGELLIRGPHLCAGYYQQEERFQLSLFDGYFRTGDLVQFDEEGFFYVVGRIKDMYISGGENVYPGEVENRLKKLADITDAVVVAVPDDKWGEVGFAFLQSRKSFSVAFLRELLGPHLSRYKHPHYLKVLTEFPLLPNGKTDRQSLKQMASSITSVKPESRV